MKKQTKHAAEKPESAKTTSPIQKDQPISHDILKEVDRFIELLSYTRNTNFSTGNIWEYDYI